MLPIPSVPAVLMEKADWTVPAPEWERWARNTFIDPEGALHDPGVAVLSGARIGFLLTNATKKKGGVRWAGSGGAYKPSGDGWVKAQATQRMVEWFGFVPDFLITLDVTTPNFLTTRGICHLVNHELRHCGQKQGPDGPMFDDTDRPVWVTVPHAAEINEGDLARWGPVMRGGDTIVRELANPPEITDETLRFDA